MHIMPDHAHPLVRGAVAALDAFGAVTPHQARTLLGMWARRDQLSDSQVADVLAHYGNADPTGLTYDRGPDDEPTGGQVPPGVHGYHVGSRHQGGEQ